MSIIYTRPAQTQLYTSYRLQCKHDPYEVQTMFVDGVHLFTLRQAK